MQDAGCGGRTIAVVSGDDVLDLVRREGPDDDLLQNLDTLSQSQRGEGSRIFVVGPDGRVVADARPAEFLKDSSRDPLVHRLLSSSALSGSFIAGVDGAPSVVTWISSPPLPRGWISPGAA